MSKEQGEVVVIMGFPAIGKTRHAQGYIDSGYVRLNRDQLGCKVNDLIKHLEEHFSKGEKNFVLDNTYMTIESRAKVIEWGKSKNLPVNCLWITAPPKKKGQVVPEPLEIAQYNAVKRMLDNYGKIVENEEMSKLKDPNVFPPVVLFKAKKSFQAPKLTEGFASLKQVPFQRDLDKSIYKNKAIIFDYDGTLRTTKSGEKYPKTPEDIEILPNRKEVLAHYKSLGYILLGVSNQSFIGKGEVSEQQAIAYFEHSNKVLGQNIDYQFCPHYLFPINCYCRKPMPGLGVLLIEKYKLDPDQTIMVGDQKTDQTFARRCGIQFKDAEQFFKTKISVISESSAPEKVDKEEIYEIVDPEEQEDELLEQKRQDSIKELTEEIEYHRELYYKGEPEISDAKYDALEDELRELDPNNAIFRTVGQDSSELFAKTEHVIPMMSQDKVTTVEDFQKWVKKRQYSEMIVQYKLDGISIELQYADGWFKRAVTRGDGKIGDNVSANVAKMKGFRPKLKTPFSGAVRGEVLMFHDTYAKTYTDMQNCRNAAAGIVRRKDGKGNQDLNIILYDAITTTDKVKFRTELHKIEWLKKEGLPAVDTKICKSPKEVVEYRQELIDGLRDQLEYDIDGLVIKGMEIDLEDMQRARPMKQIAFKFQAEEIETVLKDVEWSISGHLYTPVAIVEPVLLMGSKISRASLANPNLIKDLKLKIGSTVMISKRGDIIPKIERVIKTLLDAQEIIIPKECETCGTKLINEGTRLYCPNEQCSKRNYRRLVKWVKVLDVKLFGEKLMLEDLFNRGKVREIADLYKLTKGDIMQYGATAVKALANLEAIKEVSLAKFVAGFDIEGIAETLMQKVMDGGQDSLEKLMTANVKDIARIEGFADITATALVEGLKARKTEMMNVLKTGRLTIQGKATTEGVLKGMSVCFTGKLDKMGRKQAEDLVVKHGGQPKGSVIKGLTYLVTNSTDSTAKFEKANSQGTKIISEDEFLSLINVNN